MLFHITLFRPRPDLTAADRADLVEALETALQRIPSIRRFHVGRRVTHGAGYEALMPVSFDYAAVVEFDDLSGLQAYLEHPAHVALGRRFTQALESSVIFDYQMQGGADLQQLAQPE
jgi:Stress responsive A/B Barrel Domain